MIFNLIDINELLLKDGEQFWYTKNHDEPWTFCVHSNIFNDLEKILSEASVLMDQSKIFEYELQINGNCYDMRIISLPPGNDQIVQFIRNAIRNSQISFAWKDNPNLFIKVESFNIMQQFITKYDLQQYVLEINHQTSISANNENIAVVTFNPSIKEFNIIEKFEEYLKSIETYHPQLKYYYITFAFPWLQPQWLDHFQIALNDNMNSIVLIILLKLGKLNYSNELNIFDLLRLRLALCDYRNPLPSNIVKYQIDFMVERGLTNYIENYYLDLDQHFFAQMGLQSDYLINYLIYEFQYLFTTVKCNEEIFIVKKSESFTSNTIELVRDSDVLNTLKRKNNTNFEIRGRTYDKMSLSLFLDLIECHNVTSISLDTDYTFVMDECNLNRTITNRDSNIRVFLEGNNPSNFLEDFLMSLKILTLSNGKIVLFIKCSLIDYTIFDKLSADVSFYFNDIKITTHILEGLNQCKLKSTFGFYKCTFENLCHNWTLINNLIQLDSLEIWEDEGTWQSLFEFVMDELLRTNAKEFRFNKHFFYILNDRQNISLTSFRFIIDEINSKLELQNINNNEMVNLYDLKFGSESDSNTIYDYQN